MNKITAIRPFLIYVDALTDAGMYYILPFVLFEFVFCKQLCPLLQVNCSLEDTIVPYIDEYRIGMSGTVGHACYFVNLAEQHYIL